METPILVSEFSEWQLENCDINIFIEAKNTCISKCNFYMNEINLGYISQSNIYLYEQFSKEWLKWIPIIEKAKKRDAERKKEHDKIWLNF